MHDDCWHRAEPELDRPSPNSDTEDAVAPVAAPCLGQAATRVSSKSDPETDHPPQEELPYDCAFAVPGTEVHRDGDSMEDRLELNDEVKRYYKEQFSRREEIRDEVALEAGEQDVKIGENLRRRWVTDQAADPELHEDIQRLRKNQRSRRRI